MKTKEEKAITLIALVITIIVLLILASVTITTILEKNGIFNKAREAKVETTHAQVKEAIVLVYSEYEMKEQTKSGKNNKVASIKMVKIAQNETEKWSGFLEFLTAKEYANETGIINTKNYWEEKYH